MLINQSVLEKSTVAGIAAAMLALAGLAWVTLRPVAAPAPIRAGAQASEFSATRAMEHVRFLAAKPRPIASAANADARQYIVAQLRAMGLAPEVQTATAQRTSVDRHHNAHVALGVVNNIVVHIPGNAPDHARSPSTLLATSYDTAERSVGASLAAPVAAMLETLRIVQGGAPLASDLVVLFADGERVGGLGARAFAEHPLAKQAGLVIRFDSGGSRGPLVLIGASGNNRAAVSGWAHAAPNARGSSFMQAVYQSMPRALEMGALGKLGTARLHFANMEGSNGIGLGSRDTPGRLGVDTVQSMGDTMIALARHFGRGQTGVRPRSDPGLTPPATAAAGEAVYFDLPGIGVVDYSAASVWMWTRLTCLMFLIVCYIAVHRGDVEPVNIVNGALGFVFIATLLALTAFLAWPLFSPLLQGYDASALGAGDLDLWLLGGFAALGTGLFVVLQRGFRRAVGWGAAALGPLLCMVVLLLLASWRLPGASYALAWPLMGILMAYGALYVPKANKLAGYIRLLVLFAGMTPALLLITPLVKDIFTASSPARMNLPMAVLAMLLGIATILLTAQRRFVVPGLAAVSAACFAVASSAAPYGSEPIPQPNRMVYLKDAYTWKSYWMMLGVPLDDWSKRFFPNATQPRVQVNAFGHGSPKMWLAPAPRNEIGFPDIVVLKDELVDTGRHVRFTLNSKAAVPFIDVSLGGAGTLRTSINGRVLTDQKTNAWSLSLYGMGAQALDFRFDLNSDETTRVFIHERIPGLPPHGMPERPAGMLPPMTPMTATTIMSDTLLFR